ncbi:2-dehydropantoate 2-reductase [Leptolyngbya sp. 15MV]|nr:2-dehydropantoate 2-reductase [Leptolyngbya sp. 15MV]
MRVVAMGSGGVGGFYGGLLAALGGCEVAFVARGAHLAAMRENGLSIERDGGRAPIHLPKVEVAADPAALGRADLVLMAVKLWDTDTAIEAIRPLVGPGTAVLSLQNGVTKDEALARAFGRDRLMGGVAYVGTHIARPGVISQTGPMQRLLFGEYAGGRSARAEALLKAAMQAGIEAELSDDIRRVIWQKFVFLVGLSGLTATTRKPIGPVRDTPMTRAFLHDVMREVVAVGRADGVALPEDEADRAMQRADAVSPDMTSSLHHDLERGNRLEVPWLAGAVVEIGARHGIPTPCNRAIRDILAVHAMGSRG